MWLWRSSAFEPSLSELQVLSSNLKFSHTTPDQGGEDDCGVSSTHDDMALASDAVNLESKRDKLSLSSLLTFYLPNALGLEHQ